MMAISTAALAKCIMLVMLVVSHDGSVNADIAVIRDVRLPKYGCFFGKF